MSHYQSHAVVAQFLTNLPSSNPDNFQKWSAEGPKQNFTKKPTSYVPVQNYGPFQQVIVTEKTNILLRYLHQQFDKKNHKTTSTPAGLSKRENSNTNLNEEELARKRQRLE